MKRQRIKELWESYQTKVIPKDAPIEQIVECRRAFYAGGASIFHLLMTRISDEEEITVSDMELISGIEKEFEKFQKDVQSGKA